jgi:hypothetical protein
MVIAAMAEGKVASGDEPAGPHAKCKVEGMAYQAVFHGQPLQHPPLLF